MNKALAFLGLVLILAPLVRSEPLEWREYCEKQGYIYDVGSVVTGSRVEYFPICIFGDGEKCSAELFLVNSRAWIERVWRDKCGKNYVREIPCVTENESLSRLTKCCKGLEPDGEVRFGGGEKCIRSSPNIFQRIFRKLLW